MYIQTPICKADFPNNGHKQTKRCIFIVYSTKVVYLTKTENLTCAKVCEPF